MMSRGYDRNRRGEEKREGGKQKQTLTAVTPDALNKSH